MRDCAYFQSKIGLQVKRTLFLLKNSQWCDNHLRQTRKLHKREMVRCRSLAFCDQETFLLNSISSHSKFAVSNHQLQIQILENPCIFHLLGDVLFCINSSVNKALQNEHRNSSNIRNSKSSQYGDSQKARESNTIHYINAFQTQDSWLFLSLLQAHDLQSLALSCNVHHFSESSLLHLSFSLPLRSF